MQVVVGSMALYKHNIVEDYKDIDVWSDKDFTYELFPSGYTLDLSSMPTEIMNNLLFTEIEGLKYATPDTIFTILCSHLGWDSGKNNLSSIGGSIQWDKYKSRWLYLKGKGCKLLPDLYNKLVPYWRELFGNKDFLSLNKDKEEFFNDFVKYKYPHDELHRIISYPNKPVYTKVLKENCDVAIDKVKFDSLSFEEQVQMFQEEIVVIAIERFVLYGDNFFVGYNKALKKTITHLTKNWATEFIVLNLDKFFRPNTNMYKNYLTVTGEI